MKIATEIDMGKPVLYRYGEAKALRNATPDECAASEQAAENDGGVGVIEVGDEFCYVVD